MALPFQILEKKLHILVITHACKLFTNIFIAQDANITIVNLENGSKQNVSLGELPMLQVKFISDDLLITTGHNYSPIILGAEKSSGKW